jgi:hypothetical protein
MENRKLERRTFEEDMTCDYCNCDIKAGSSAFVITFTDDYEISGEVILCSPTCLDEYEAEEFLKSEEYRNNTF